MVNLYMLDKVMKHLENPFMHFSREVFKGQLTTVVNLTAFPDNDSLWCKEFAIPVNAFFRYLADDFFAIREPKEIAEFLENYTWDSTNAIYYAAKRDGLIVKEKDIE